jgi:hypothetical protein
MNQPKKIRRKTIRLLRAERNRLRQAKPALRLVASRNKRLRKRAAAVLPKRRLAKQNAKSQRAMYIAEEIRREALAKQAKATNVVAAVIKAMDRAT